MTTFLIALSALALWLGLCAAAFRAPATIHAAVLLLRRHGGRHAR
ncbi:hypothetical protein [Streptomyces sp. NBC_01506]